MLIKSNFKDYYDFLAGKYGIDTKAAYERVQAHKYAYGDYDEKVKWEKGGYNLFGYDTENFKQLIIAFCGTIYYVIYYKGNFYYGNEYKLLSKFIRDKYQLDTNVNLFQHGKKSEIELYHLSKTDANEKENCPIMLVNRERHNLESTFWGYFKNPKLADFKFAKAVTPEDAWTTITNFLLRESILENKMTDIEKVVSHGFDKKTSFRKM